MIMTLQRWLLLLTINGYEAQIANDGKSGFEIAREYKPDAILMDILMRHRNSKQPTR
jgi:DNA-binding response OmpR family regulator